MSTSTSGWVSRKLSNGIRLWPPARTLARWPCSANRARASSSVFGAWYSNCGGFIGQSLLRHSVRTNLVRPIPWLLRLHAGGPVPPWWGTKLGSAVADRSDYGPATGIRQRFILGPQASFFPWSDCPDTQARWPAGGSWVPRRKPRCPLLAQGRSGAAMVGKTRVGRRRQI